MIFRVFNFETQVDTESDNVRVVVRCRPMNEKEVAGGCGLAVNVEESRGIITVKNPSARTGEPPKQFTYDRVFGVDTKQVDVYNDAARPIVNCVLEGYNGEKLVSISLAKLPLKKGVRWDLQSCPSPEK